MPTVILLDVSLSMTSPVQFKDGTETTRKQLAEIGINAFLDHLSIQSKLEFISLNKLNWCFGKISKLYLLTYSPGSTGSTGCNQFAIISVQ